MQTVPLMCPTTAHRRHRPPPGHNDRPSPGRSSPHRTEITGMPGILDRP
jgi:hypothetical protein